MNIGEAQDAERSQHQNADARAEISSIERDEELKGHRADQPARGFVRFGM
jgi:hypothetical protein